MSKWMIYGATGYTGAKIAEKAKREGHEPILAGRSDNVRTIAKRLNLPVRVFDLNDRAATLAALEGVNVILNCAGPFIDTAAAMIDACLAKGVHYLDITGEIPVFEHAHSRHAEAVARGIVVCPGVGFDVIPTDCVASALKEALPDATHLSLGFDTASPLSPGTAKSVVEGLGFGGKMRKHGKIVTVPFAHSRRTVDLGYGVRCAMALPWGDVATAHYSTGIPNITTYIACPRPLALLFRSLNGSRYVMRLKSVRNVLHRAIDRWVHGPDEQQLRELGTAVWGEARNAKGEVRVARVKVANGYALTVNSALTMVQFILNRNSAASGGYFTPAQLTGWRLIEQLPGSGSVVLSNS